MVMLEISCSFMVYINNQSCIQVFGTTAGESKQLSYSSDINLLYRKDQWVNQVFGAVAGDFS